MRGNEYSPKLCVQVGEACAAVYDDAWKPLDEVRVLKERVAAVMLDEALAIVFCGSNSGASWISNMKAVHTSDAAEALNGGKVHYGFEMAWSAFLQRPVDDMVSRLLAIAKGLPLILAGHSRGGALAMRAAIELAKRGDVRSVYTFGSPRWCDKIAAREYDMVLGQRTFKVVNNNDLVPSLPPWRLGWQHVGRMVYIDRKGRVHPDVHTRPFWDRALGALAHLGKPGLDAVRDHSGGGMRSYLVPLRNDLARLQALAA